MSWYAASSAATFAAYALDKRRAVNGGSRLRERTLHLLALLGGWPGAHAGRWLLRHKTRKRGFSFVLWLITLLHAAAWCVAFYAF